ncbi:MAG: tetratricopeptide repeat protein [Candidatus Omnitrophota bacterium]
MINFKKVLNIRFLILITSLVFLLGDIAYADSCLRIPLLSQYNRREFLSLMASPLVFNRLIQAEKQSKEFDKIAGKFQAIYASIEAKTLDQKRREQELIKMLIDLRAELKSKGLLEVECPFLESLVGKFDLEGDIFQDIEKADKVKDKKARQKLKRELTLCTAKAHMGFILLNSIGVKNVKEVASENHASVAIELDNGRYLIADFTINLFEVIVLSNSEDSRYRKRGGYWFLKDKYKIPNERLNAIKRQLNDIGTVTELLTIEEIRNAWYPFIYITDSPKGTEVSMRLKRGLTYYELGLFEKARKEYATGISLDSYCAELYNNAGRLYSSSNIWNEAFPLFKKAVDLNPENALAHCNMGTAYAVSGDWENAVKSQEEALRLDSGLIIAYGNLADATLNLGEAYRSQNKLEEANNRYSDAIRQYQRAIKFAPGDSALHLGIGIANYRLKKYDEAMKEFKAVNKLNKDWWEPYYFYGMIAYETGKREEAVKFFEEGLMRHPNNDKYISKLPEDEALRKHIKLKAQQSARPTSNVRIGLPVKLSSYIAAGMSL